MKDIKNIDDINLINELLSSGETLKSISEKEDFPSAKTMQRRIKELGFKYHKKLKILVFKDSLEDDNTDVTPSENTAITPSNTMVTQSDISEILKRIEILENKVLHNNTSVTPIKIKSQNDIITRSIKVSKRAMTKFTELCENKYPMYSKQDLISLALLEFIENHKK